MNQISPFKLTPEDLAELDPKVRNGLNPLLDALNITLQQLVQAVNGAPAEQYVDVTLTTADTVAPSFPLVFKHAIPKPRAVLLANIRPRDPDHVLTAPFVMQGFALTDNGLVSIPWITNLLALNSYDLTFLVR